jgi:hypothetical protein
LLKFTRRKGKWDGWAACAVAIDQGDWGLLTDGRFPLLSTAAGAEAAS